MIQLALGCAVVPSTRTRLGGVLDHRQDVLAMPVQGDGFDEIGGQ